MATVVHEIGHMFGIGHCIFFDCVLAPGAAANAWHERSIDPCGATRVTAAMLIAAALACIVLAAPPPEATDLALPVALRLAVDGQREHACSRSFASTHDAATLVLDVSLRGVATLTFDQRSHEVFGPSPSRYRDGDHAFTRTTRAHHIVWKGHVAIGAHALAITFDGALVSEAVWLGEGSLPLPEPTPTPAAWTLACRIVSRTVYPAMDPPSAYASPDDTQAAALLAVASCSATSLPEPLARLVPTFAHDGIPFASGRGLVLAASTRSGDEASLLRRAH